MFLSGYLHAQHSDYVMYIRIHDAAGHFAAVEILWRGKALHWMMA